MTYLALPKRYRGVKKDSHAHAPKQEAGLAAKLGGKTIKGSGSGDVKGDVRIKDVVRIEAKCTLKNSFSITKEMIRKIEEAAIASGEMPVIAVDFLDDKGKVTQSVAVMPMYALHSLLEPK